MKLDFQVKLNFKGREVTEAVKKAAQLAMRDTVVDITNDAVHGSPVKTAHNRRSLVCEVSGLGIAYQGEEAEPERVVDDSKLEGAVYSTSGYGGFLETGTSKMAARPYIKPAADRHAPKFPDHLRERLRA